MYHIQIDATLNEISATLRLLKVNDGNHTTPVYISCTLSTTQMVQYTLFKMLIIKLRLVLDTSVAAINI